MLSLYDFDNGSLKVDRETIEPYEDRESASDYEKSVKSRPDPIFIQVRELPDNAAGGRISLCVNVKAMEHRARGRLPTILNGPVRFTTRVITDSKPVRHSSFPKFRISETKEDATNLDLQMSINLFPKQLQQLMWQAGFQFLLETDHYSEEVSIMGK